MGERGNKGERLQETMLQQQSDDPKEHYKYVAKIGVAQDRKPNIPRKVVLPRGSASHDRDVVLNHRRNEFEVLLNPDVNIGHSMSEVSTSTAVIRGHHSVG